VAPIDHDNGRTHEPSLRELTAELDGMRQLLLAKLSAIESVIDERDRMYKERDDARRTAVDAAFAAQKEAINTAMAAADRAVSKAELATEKRFESVNEFRATLDNQQRTLIPRAEVDVLMRGSSEKIIDLIKTQDELKSVISEWQAERIGVRGGWGYAVGAVGFMLALGSLVMIGIRFVQRAP